MTRVIKITEEISFGGGNAPMFIAGPCVIESRDHLMKMAEIIKKLRDDENVNIVFKASYDKANRTSIASFRGPGLDEGLKLLAEVKRETGMPVLSDIHEPHHAKPAAEVLDILQIPAFLCRQTDLIAAAAETMKPVGVKKGQFLSPEETKNILDKGDEIGNPRVFLTERGTTFGYQNLVVDMRSFPIMRSYGQPVVYDITHSMQRPGGAGTETAGTRQFARPLARAAAATGVDGFFMEVHNNPSAALSDKATQLDVETARRVIREVMAIRIALAETFSEE
jgi:2-dehydro-3-deoxyphosphooctonate aldolase (KDO 8-P synthase)